MCNSAREVLQTSYPREHFLMMCIDKLTQSMHVARPKIGWISHTDAQDSRHSVTLTGEVMWIFTITQSLRSQIWSGSSGE
jgi:hypothetical protein